jgi:superfamily II DNA or RNA helicase
MKGTIAERTQISGLCAEQYQQLIKSLTFENPKFKEALKFGRSTHSIPRHIELFEVAFDGSLIIPRGISLEWLNLHSIEDLRNSHPVYFSSTIESRDYQEKVIKAAIGQNHGLIVAPTGAGKTAMAIEIAARLSERCLILVKSIDLARQWQAAIKQFTGLDCGLIGGGKKQEGEQFTVALIQTLVKYEESLDYGLLIVDEAHNIPAKQAFAVINRQAAKYRFGLSATPQRRDNLEFMIHASLGPVIAEVHQDELEGAVLPVKVTSLNYEFTGNPDSWANFIYQLTIDSERNRLLVSKAIKASGSMGIAVLTASVSHAEELQKMISLKGTNALLLHGQLPKKVREERMIQAASAQLIIGTLSLLSEGIDWPHIGGIIFATPVSAATDKGKPAATRLIQSIGRARRPYPGKTAAFVLDIVDQHPFGLSVYKKRCEIYQQQGFSIQEHEYSHYSSRREYSD